MRLVCPNCDAQYEVDASAIPVSGRDVQCSNCGNAWFQEPGPVTDAIAASLYLAPEPERPWSDTFEADLAATLGQPDVPKKSVPATPALDEAYDEEDEGPAPPLPAVARRTLDDSVLAVLREEAELEVAARRADAASLEMQGDLGLPPPVPLSVGKAAYAAPTAPAPTEMERRLASLKGEVVAPAKPAARRDLLPDIEEINSTLSPSASSRSARDEVDDLPDLLRGKRKKSGFGSGFALMLVLAGLAMTLYIMAPQISQQIPGAASAMDAYVALVDAARLWLDQLIRQATGALNGLTGNQG